MYVCVREREKEREIQRDSDSVLFVMTNFCMVHPPREPLRVKARVTLFTFPLLAGTTCWFFFSSSAHIRPHALFCLFQTQGTTTCEPGNPTCTRGTRVTARRDHIYRMFTRGHEQVCVCVCVCVCTRGLSRDLKLVA